MGNYIALNKTQIDVINTYFKEKIIDPEIAWDKTKPIRISFGAVGDQEIEIRYPGDGGYTAQTLTPGSISLADDKCDVDDKGRLVNEFCDEELGRLGETRFKITTHEVMVFMAAIAPTEFMPMNSIFQDSGVKTLRQKLGL